MREKGFGVSKNPILKSLETIECRDALLNPDGTEAEWPEADVIIGNPPFLGDKLMIAAMGLDYVSTIREVYRTRVPGAADFVCYWFSKSREALTNRKALLCGLVATNSIRGGANREVLDAIVDDGRVFEAWSDEPWVLDGAQVRVSIISFSIEAVGSIALLNGEPVAEIFSDLTARVDLSEAQQLTQNEACAFIGDQKSGPFDIPRDLAAKWLCEPLNPNGLSNAAVLRPWQNGLDVTRRPSENWIIDFGVEMSLTDAGLFEAPFKHVAQHVGPMRANVRRDGHRNYWWRHGEPRPGMRKALTNLRRYLATPRVAKYRLFVWLDRSILPDCQLVVVARDDDTSFGILHSKFHELWSLRMCTWLGVGNDPRYTPTTCFETFPFPEGLAPNIPAADYASDPRAIAIAKAAARLNELRENWLNPPDLVQRVPEVVPGYPDRILPVDDKAAAILKKRTLTNLYNERPAWLDMAHKDLDAAVAAAYGWPADLSDDEILERLFKLNQERAAKQGS
jgi:type II restriction/modification system DNA methylase subunit YeeA